MEVDLQSLFGLHVSWCAQVYSLAKTPQLPPSPRIWTRITRALLVSKDRRHLFVTPWSLLTNSALVYESKCGGMGGIAGSHPMSTAVHITWHGAQINFGDLPPYLSYGRRYVSVSKSNTIADVMVVWVKAKNKIVGIILRSVWKSSKKAFFIFQRSKRN